MLWCVCVCGGTCGHQRCTHPSVDTPSTRWILGGQLPDPHMRDSNERAREGEVAEAPPADDPPTDDPDPASSIL